MEDISLLGEVDKFLFHGVKPLEGTCKKCKTITKIELDRGQALILPFREREKSTSNRIRFGSSKSGKRMGH